MLRLLATALCGALIVGIAADPSAAVQNAWDASISGSLVKAGTHVAVSGVEVKAFTPHGGTVLGKGTSESHGYFVITGLRGGEYRIQFNGRGYHETAVVGLYVKPHTRLHLPGTIAMYALGMKVPRLAGAGNPCGMKPDPNESADVYVICSEP